MRLTLLDILVVDDTAAYAKKLEPQRTDALAVVRRSEGHVALCTTFDPYKLANPDFAAQAIKGIDEDFAQGAVAVKLWKNLGMEIKRAGGAFLMPDDSILEPIYKDIAEHHHTIVAHLAEPDACWEPPIPDDQSYLGVLRGYVAPYYTHNPEWYMYMHPDHPSKQAILAARDHLLEMNPHLRVVGAHLGSMETDVNEIAKRLDKYPNFAVESGGRTFYLMLQPREKVRAFLIKYQDRILYGTDLQIPATEDIQGALREWETTYAQDWKFLATDETFQVEGHEVHGLKLPEGALAKIFHRNAVRWIPGIVAEH
jgi:predicted TIM-barrel fold metal-dependent hydrolase